MRLETCVELVKSDVAEGAGNTTRPLTHSLDLTKEGLAVDATQNIESAVPSQPYWRPCDECGTQFRVRPGDVRKNLKRGHQPPRFCTRACQLATYKGDGNPHWRGGRFVSVAGYVHVRALGHPQADKDGYYEEHRLVMEKHIGRILDPSECVHHFNHNRADNRIENLELMQSWGEHQRRHGYYEPRKCANCGEIVMRSRALRRKYPRSYCSAKCAAAGGSRANAEAAKTRKPPKRIRRSQ